MKMKNRIPSKLCPINFECFVDKRGNSYALEDGGYCSNSSYCANLAAPWPLPYQIWDIDYYYPKGALIVSIPCPTNWEEINNNEWEIQAAEEWDSWINYVRTELKEAGWANPIELPYEWDEVLCGLIITLPLIFEEEHNKHPAQGFAPAVTLDNWRANWHKGRNSLLENFGIDGERHVKRDRWGFYLPYGIPGLAWKWQEEDEED